MSCFDFSGTVFIFSSGGDDACERFAVEECERLLARCRIELRQGSRKVEGCSLVLSCTNELAESDSAELNSVQHDGFTINVTPNQIGLHAKQAKGLLNAVYELAEQLGFWFEMPGEQNEWLPEKLNALALECGEQLFNPRFPWRGIFGGCGHAGDFTKEEWLHYYAKLKYNALANETDLLPLCSKLGIRLETGRSWLQRLCCPGYSLRRSPNCFACFSRRILTASDSATRQRLPRRIRKRKKS